MKDTKWIKDLPVVTETEVRPRNCIVIYNDGLSLDIIQNGVTRFSSKDGWRGYTNVAFEVAIETGKINLVTAYIQRWDYMQTRERQRNWKFDKTIAKANQSLQIGFKWNSSK